MGYPSPTSGTTFRRGGSSPAEAEALLVDAEWAAPEPVIVEDHANGNGRTAVPVGGDAGDDETQERQRSLFSWSGFMADETPEPKGRRWDEASTLSLFEWALDCVACESVLVHIWREGLERVLLHGKRHDGGY